MTIVPFQHSSTSRRDIDNILFQCRNAEILIWQFLDGNSEELLGIWDISDAVTVNRFISCYFVVSVVSIAKVILLLSGLSICYNISLPT